MTRAMMVGKYELLKCLARSVDTVLWLAAYA